MTSQTIDYERYIFEQLTTAPEVLFLVLDHNKITQVVSPQFAKILGATVFELIGLKLTNLPLALLSDNHDIIGWQDTELWKQFECQHDHSESVFRFQNLSDQSFIYRAKLKRHRVDGKVVFSIIFIDQKEMLPLEENQRLWQEVFNLSNEAIMLTDAQPAILKVNPSFVRISGYSVEEAVGQNPSFLSSGAHHGDFYSHLWKALREEGQWRGSIVNRKKNGELYSEFATISEIRNNLGQVTNYVSIFSKTSKDQQVDDHDDSLATSLDVLTALPKRTILLDRLEQAIGYAKRHHLSVAILYVDLDHFSNINEQYGKPVGDKVIKTLSNRLLSAIRHDDSLSRYGGDEFVIVLRDLDRSFQLDDFIQRLMDKVGKATEVNDNLISLTASVGITQYPNDDTSAETLIRHADHAMSIAKSHGRSNFVYYSRKTEDERNRNLAVREQILRAVENDEFELYGQPQFDVSKGKLYGIELLLRWNSPVRGLLMPDDFLIGLKDKDLLNKIDRWVVKKSLHLIQSVFLDSKFNDIKVGVNLTPASLQDAKFHGWLERQLDKYSTDITRKIEFEILESDALDNLDIVRSLISKLEKYDVSFSLDDFGTGYSSLSIFNQLSVNSIKIDRSFISQMVEDHRNLSLIKAICEMSKIFERKIIAEGVEYSEQAQLLTHIGCNIVQGYGISRPIPILTLIDWLHNFKLDAEWVFD